MRNESINKGRKVNIVEWDRWTGNLWHVSWLEYIISCENQFPLIDHNFLKSSGNIVWVKMRIFTQLVKVKIHFTKVHDEGIYFTGSTNSVTWQCINLNGGISDNENMEQYESHFLISQPHPKLEIFVIKLSDKIILQTNIFIK